MEILNKGSPVSLLGKVPPAVLEEGSLLVCLAMCPSLITPPALYPSTVAVSDLVYLQLPCFLVNHGLPNPGMGWGRGFPTGPGLFV